MPAMRTPFISRTRSTVGKRSFGQMPSRKSPRSTISMMSCTRPMRSAMRDDLADDGKFRLQADVDRAHHLLDARDRRAAQQHDRRGNAAVAQAADVFEARFRQPDDAAAQHGARHLRHAAGALGDAEHLDAGVGAAPHHSARVALDAAEIDGDFRSGHLQPL